mmetsp:Transcript_8253/g.20471  ORF Transcript_8253/g.20471 Transcript_8253/m.20471 type:complete len:227 (-) Transcript_8253:494-1174(-)
MQVRVQPGPPLARHLGTHDLHHRGARQAPDFAAALQGVVAQETVHEPGCKEVPSARGVFDAEPLKRLLLHPLCAPHGQAPFVAQRDDGDLAPVGQPLQRLLDLRVLLDAVAASAAARQLARLVLVGEHRRHLARGEQLLHWPAEPPHHLEGGQGHGHLAPRGHCRVHAAFHQTWPIVAVAVDNDPLDPPQRLRRDVLGLQPHGVLQRRPHRALPRLVHQAHAAAGV